MVLEKFMSKFAQNKAKFKEMETDAKMGRLLEQKQKSANERELERFIEEDRQEAIKQELIRRRKEKSLFNKGNLLKGEKIFDHKMSISKDDKSVLAGNNMFLKRGNMF